MSDRTIAAEGTGFTPPGPSDFEPTPFFTVGGWEVDKIVLVVTLATLAVALFFYASSRRAASGNGMVPGKLQFAGEGVYGFVRNGVARDVIGDHDEKWNGTGYPRALRGREIPLAARIVAVALLVVAAILAQSGRGTLRAANFKPEQTIETLKEDQEWAKQQINSVKR